MNKQQVIEALNKAKETSPKRNFKQSIDIIINLRDLDLKKPEQQVNLYVQVPNQRGKKTSICAFVGPELQPTSKENCDETILDSDFGKFTKKDIKKLSEKHDFFIAQATIMPKVATVFGRVLGPRGKMPNPKAGCVVPPNANLKAIYEKLQKTIKVVTKNDPIIQCSIGKEDMSEEHIADNFLAIYNAVLHAVPNEENNVKDAYLKFTMGKPIKVSAPSRVASQGKSTKKKQIKQQAIPKEEQSKQE